MDGLSPRATGKKAPCLDVLELGEAIVAARPRLEASVRRMTPNIEDARFLLHETLREAWRRREDLTLSDDVHTWLMAILRRRVLQ
jgi:DNA-directed RNA polymerase specialized sigma24 family protein